MKFFDRYGVAVKQGDIMKSLMTDNLLEVLSVSEGNVTCKIVDKYTNFAPINIPTSNDGYNYVVVDATCFPHRPMGECL